MAQHVLITRARVTDLVILARCNGHSGHVFPGTAGSLGILFSHALQQVLLTIAAGDGTIDQTWMPAKAVEDRIWQALTERLPWLVDSGEVHA